MKTFRSAVLPVVITAFIPCTVFSQSLDLFQETDNSQRTETTERRTQRNRESVSEPAFTLVGTSRFGEKYFASLLSREGKSLNVEWTPGKVVNIEGFLNYGLANVDSRTSSIRLPASETCIESEEKGVKCNGNIAVLTLSNGAPIERAVNLDAQSEGIVANINSGSEVEAETVDPEPEDGRTIPGTNVLRRNPFSGELQTLPNLTAEEQAAREQRRAERAEQFRNFEVVRIPDDEIPDGMRRVRTPFGDSLEPIED